MYQLTVSYATHEELLAAVLALGGETAPTPLAATLDRLEGNLGVAGKTKPGRKSAADKKAATAEATAAGFESPAAPAPATKTTAEWVAELKTEIGKHSKGDAVKIGAFVAGLGVEKISDLAVVQIKEVLEQGQVAAFFAPANIDPMS